MSPDKRLQFQYSSLADMQSTIRAIDTKAYILLIVLLFPLAELPSVVHVYERLLKLDISCPLKPSIVALLAAFAMSWGICIFLSVFTVHAISSPSVNTGERKPKGTFYPISKVRNYDLSRFVADLPDSEHDISVEIAHEQLKVGDILLSKMLKIKWAYWIFFLWLVLGVLVVVLDRILYS